MKKFLSLLCSVLIISFFIQRVSASAQSNITNIKDMQNSPYLLMITDGKILNSDLFFDVSTSQKPEDCSIFEISPENYADFELMDVYPETAKLYAVDFTWNLTEPEPDWMDMYYARKTMLAHNEILYTGRSYYKDTTYVSVDIALTFCTNDSKQMIEFTKEMLNVLESKSEYTQVENFLNDKREWKNKLAAILSDCNMDTLTIEELDTKLKAEKMRTIYEMENYTQATGNIIVSAFSDTLTDVVLKSEHIYPSVAPDHCIDIWNGVGAMNGNANADAADAAKILMESAKKGAGTGAFSEYVTSFMDVNADETINAVDASIVLEYAAAIGTGKNVPIRDFIK